MKQEYTSKILDLLRTLPKDRIKHYASFKDVQIARFSDAQTLKSASEQDLQLQYVALRDLVNDKYRNYYRLSDKLTRPKGNPRYYDRLMRSVRGEGRESIFETIRTVVMGR